jgi:hypothetical protein
VLACAGFRVRGRGHAAALRATPARARGPSYQSGASAALRRARGAAEARACRRAQAASCERDGFAALARVLRGDATSAALRKADFLHLTRVWGYASDVWCARGAWRARGAGVGPASARVLRSTPTALTQRGAPAARRKPCPPRGERAGRSARRPRKR